MKVKELIEVLKECDQDAGIGLDVYGHTWYDGCHNGSHGQVQVADVKLHFSRGDSRVIVLLSVGAFSRSSGYLPEEVVRRV